MRLVRIDTVDTRSVWSCGVNMALGKLSIIVFSGRFDRVHFALTTAAAAAAIDRPVTLFFTMAALRGLADGGNGTAPGWHGLEGTPAADDAQFKARGVADFETLLDSCVALDVTFMACEMGLRAIAMTANQLRGDVPVKVTGLVTFLTDCEAAGQTLFI